MNEKLSTRLDHHAETLLGRLDMTMARAFAPNTERVSLEQLAQAAVTCAALAYTVGMVLALEKAGR